MITDQLNADIWEHSPELQRQIQSPFSLLNEGSVGAQQAMIDDDPNAVLPWVPDLIGEGWQDVSSILIVGSAYAGFIKEYSSRDASMPLLSYRQAQTAAEFQREFLRMVVMPDRKYYGLIPLMLPQDWDSSRIALFDLCRASFVQRANRINEIDISGDPIVRKNTKIFHQYTMQGLAAEWTWQRIIQSRACRIVALGTIAEHGLLRLFASHGMEAFVQCQPKIRFGRKRVTASVNWPCRYAGRLSGNDWNLGNWYDAKSSYPTDSFWVIEGEIEGERRTWYMRPTNHPSDRNPRALPSPAATRRALAEMEQMMPQTA